MVETEDKGGLRKKFLYKTPGHFTKHHLDKIVKHLRGLDEDQGHHEPKSTKDDVTTGEGLSEAMSIDAIREWRKP